MALPLRRKGRVDVMLQIDHVRFFASSKDRDRLFVAPLRRIRHGSDG